MSEKWYRVTAEETVQQLKSSSEQGLSPAEAQARLTQYGSNELVERGVKSPWVIFLNQFKEVMVIVLILAAIVSAALGEFTEVVVILAIVVLNAILGFTQEYRAEQAMDALSTLISCQGWKWEQAWEVVTKELIFLPAEDGKD